MSSQKPKAIATVGETKKLLNRNNFRIKKSLGQNFIIEPKIIEDIVAAAQICPADVVVEIGPGMGSLTQGLAAAAGQVLGIELDQNLIPILEDSFKAYPNVTIVHQDALKADYNQLLAPLWAKGSYTPDFVVVANLPYYITTPIIMNLLEGEYPWRRLILMVQKEVANRMKSAPGSKEYGSLSIAVQYRAAAKIALEVPPSAFMPRPAVDSAVIVLERLPQPAVEVLDEANFFRVVGAGFCQRRKTLLNSLTAGLGLPKEKVAEALAEAEIAGSRRGETLSLAEYARLSDIMLKILKIADETSDAGLE